MLRVNLLPPYIFDKQKKIRLVVVWAAALAAVIVLISFFALGAQNTLSASEKHLTEAKDYQSKYQALDTQINDTKTKIAATAEKQKFIADAQTYNDSWPRVYTAMASVTSPDILLNSMSVDQANHKSIRLAGFTETEANLARWWMSLRNNVDMFDSVYISLPSHPFSPQSGGAGRGFGQGFGGMSGMGMPGGMAGMRGGGFSGMGGGMPGRGMGGFPGGMPGMPGGFPGGMPGMGGMGGGRGGGASGGATPAIVEGRNGLNFIAMAVVKDPLAPPAVAPAWPAGAGGGGIGGGFPGGMGGMPGMPGGMMPGRGGMMPGGMPPGAMGAPGGAGKGGGMGKAD